jgi:hypothetical protein
MKKLLLGLCLILTFNAWGLTPPDEVVRVIARIQSQGGNVKIVRSAEKDVIPSLLEDQKLKDVIGTLQAGDEAVIEGRITYQTTYLEGQTTFKPVFIISSITPISLKRLAQADRVNLDNTLGPSFAPIEYFNYSQASFPVSTKVASAMTLTTAALLMNSLSAGPTTPHTSTQLNSGMFLFAGLMATGVFLFEQINTNK